MRKIIVTEMITLDGVIQGPGGVGEDTAVVYQTISSVETPFL